MRLLLAYLFRFLFRFSFFKKKFFGFHQHIFQRYHLFKGVVCTVNYNGFKLKLYIDDWIQENIFFLREYESAEMKAMNHFLKKDSVFLDIGGNIGLYSLIASKTIQNEGKIYSFEPFSINNKRFHANIQLNQITNIQLEKLAVGDTNGNIHLYYNEAESNLGMVSTKQVDKAIQEEVQIVSIDNYLRINNIDAVDFIKIDVEGFEYAVLQGMENTLTQFHPPILIELLDADENAQKVEVFLVNLDYKKNYIDDNGNLFDTEKQGKRKNYIFTFK